MVSELTLALATVAAPASPTLDQFEAVLASQDSATMALEQWCAAQGIADPALIRARPIAAAGNDPPADIRKWLAVGPDDRIGARNVALSCGETVLSVAWNWYVPSRLTPEMNEALRNDVPFGKVVAPLGFKRRPLATLRGRTENCPEGTISTHRAMLILPDGRPLAYLIECYTAANLADAR